MDRFQLIQLLMQDLDSLSLKSVCDWETGVRMASSLVTLKKMLQKEEDEKKQERDRRIEELRKERKRELEEAEKNGLTILGGETIEINADGTSEVIVP